MNKSYVSAFICVKCFSLWYSSLFKILPFSLGNVAWRSSWRSISTSTWIFSCILIYYNYIIKYNINNCVRSTSKINWVGLNWWMEITKNRAFACIWFGIITILFLFDRLYILIQLLRARKLKLYNQNKKPMLEIGKSILLMRMSHPQLKQISADYKVNITTNRYKSYKDVIFYICN